MERKKNKVNKSQLKDLCKEDKAKVGELIEKIAQEKRQKNLYREEIERLVNEVEKFKGEKEKAVAEKERVLVKLDKCMEIVQGLQVKGDVGKVDVYTQTLESGGREGEGERVRDQVMFDEMLFGLVHELEVECNGFDDPGFMKVLRELEFEEN